MKIIIDNSSDIFVNNNIKTFHFDPLKHFLNSNQQSELFSDLAFSFPDKYKQPYLCDQVEDCLLKEHQENLSCKWAPLAILQILWPLKRYLWIKQCLINLIDQYSVNEILILSSEDKQLNHAASYLSKKNNIIVDFEDSSLYCQNNLLHEMAPYAIPKFVDPKLFFYINLFLNNSNKTVWLQTYNNLNNNRRTYHLSINRIVAVFNGIKQKIFGKDPLTYTINYDIYGVLNRRSWEVFEEDEIKIIDVFLSNFFYHHPKKILDKFYEYFDYTLSIRKPKSIFLNSDRVDLHRMIFYTAKKHHIETINIPHGLLHESTCGTGRRNDFQPNIMLAWNENSSARLRQNNWESSSFSHPLFTSKIEPYKPLNLKNSCDCIVLLPDWVGLHLELGDDIFALSAYNYCQTLSDLGLKYSFKTHASLNKYQDQNRKKTLSKLKEYYDFKIIDNEKTFINIVSDYDLVFAGSTTGIYEAMIKGIPVIGVNLCINEIGAIGENFIPNVDAFDEIYSVLEDYNNEKVSTAYSQLIESFKKGYSIDQIIQNRL